MPWLLVIGLLLFGAFYTEFSQRRAMQALQFDLLVESVKIRIVADDEGRIVGFTPAAAAFFGFNNEQVMWGGIDLLIAPESQAALRSKYTESM